GLALIRRLAKGSAPPAATLAGISIANGTSAALGPLLGGFLVALAGWQGIFAVNVPLTVLGLYLAFRWLPRDAAPAADRSRVAFYAVFYGLPLWLQRVRGFAAEDAGLLMLPLAALGIGLSPVAARMVRQRGIRTPLLIGCAALIAGLLAVLTLDEHTAVVGIV